MPKLKDPNVWFQNARRVTEDPAASDWLKNALLEAINRDPVDAAGDAEVLCRILKTASRCGSKGAGTLRHDRQVAEDAGIGED
jgi:hypothetical protein